MLSVVIVVQNFRSPAAARWRVRRTVLHPMHSLLRRSGEDTRGERNAVAARSGPGPKSDLVRWRQPITCFLTMWVRGRRGVRAPGDSDSTHATCQREFRQSAPRRVFIAAGPFALFRTVGRVNARTSPKSRSVAVSCTVQFEGRPNTRGEHGRVTGRCREIRAAVHRAVPCHSSGHGGIDVLRRWGYARAEGSPRQAPSS